MTATRWMPALTGLLAMAVGLGVSELVAGALTGTPSLVLAVGDVVVDHVPGWLERAAISNLGHAVKPVLVASVLAGCAVAGAAIGLLAARRPVAGAASVVAVFAIGAAAALGDPQADGAAPVVPGAAGALAAVATLLLLARAMAGTGAGEMRPVPPMQAGDVERRRFLAAGAVALLVAGATAAAGRALTARERVDAARRRIRLPRPRRPAPPAPAGAALDVEGITPLYMPGDRFYRIDTALTVPQVDPAGWTLSVEGRVRRPLRLTYDDLLAMDQVEADITLACVSNEVGGDLVGNARWQGVPLRHLLERAGIGPGAEQVLGRSVDGFTAGFPVETGMRTEFAMVAVGMNGEPLPAEHGFPARLLVPGLYGYVSATKWLAAIELTSWDVDGYWIPRGWSKEGPIKTQSRIDVPAAGSTLAPGRRPIAGVAWAPTRGIERVEVRVDDGPWEEARLAASLGPDSWRQWVLPWDAPPGDHTIAVRATDGSGVTQTGSRTPIAPNGATGWHTIEVRVA